MEYYKVLIKVLLKEVNKFNLDTEVLYSTYMTRLNASLAENFDEPYYRCAYLYRYATCNIYFFNDCIKKFLQEYSNAKDVFSLWKSYSEVKVCSLSVGPGLDYLGFLLAILEYDPSPPNFNGAKIVSKHSGWKNTVNFMLEVFREQGTAFNLRNSCWPNLKYENVDFIQLDLLKSYSGIGKVLVNEAVSEANVVLMMRTLNLSDVENPEKRHLLYMLKELICSLKAEAIIFCIDTKPSIALLTQAFSHFPGKFLYGPFHETDRLPVDFPVIGGCRPVISMRGTFFVWQKLSMSAHLNLRTPQLANISVGAGVNKDNITAASSSDENFNSSTEKNEVKVASSDEKSNSSTVENEVKVASSNEESNSSAVENEVKVQDTKSDSDLDLSWIELKSFWKCSSPKTKELLKRLMSANEEEVNYLISQPEKSDIDEKNQLSITETAMFQDIKSSGVNITPLNITQIAMLDDIKAIPIPLQNQDLTLHEGNSSDSVGSLSPASTLNSVSSFTCENDSSSSRIEGRSTGTIPKNSETLLSYQETVKDNSTKVNSAGNTLEVDSVKIQYCENRGIQTNTHQDIPTSLSVEALTERIRRLEISLESVSQLNKPRNYGGDDYNELHNCETEGLHNFIPNRYACTADKPSCSKQSSSCGSKNQDSLPSYESGAKKNIIFQNMDYRYSCQCFHYKCHMYCCSRSCDFKPCCAQPLRRCNFSCNGQQSIENNLGNFTSPTIVIPVQHISNNTLLQIISDLKSQ